MTAIRVYVAGPYTADPETCTRAAIEVGDRLLDLGFAPFVPHLSHYWNTQHTEHEYEAWMRLDLAWVETADVLLRIPGESPGADREVKHARVHGIPVVTSVEDLLAWARSGERA